MPAPTVSFKSILSSVAAEAGFTYSTLPSAGTDKERWANYATRIMEWIWRCPNRMFAFDFSTETETVTITDGKFATSLIDYSDWWSLWNQDPRPFMQNNGNWPNVWTWRIYGLQSADYIYPQTTEGSVFAFYRRATPRFSSTVVAISTTYLTDQIVYDDRTGVSASTGDCYKCVAGYTTPNNEPDLTTDLANTAKWTRQSIPAVLEGTFTDFVNAKRLQSLGNTEKKRDVRAEAEQWLDLEMARQMPRDGAGPPWAYNGAPGYFELFNRC